MTDFIQLQYEDAKNNYLNGLLSNFIFYIPKCYVSFEQVQNLCLISSCTGNIINNFSIFTRTLLNAKKILLVELPITITLRVLADKVLTFYLRDLSHTYMLFLAMCFYQIK